MRTKRLGNRTVFVILAVSLSVVRAVPADELRRPGIEIYASNPFYWQFNGRPTLLLGASDNDNLFQSPQLEEELDRLHEAGGNYVRCTMSSRDPDDLWPYAKDEAGKFDLDDVNPDYWQRFSRFLELTSSKDIIVQVEIWATYDFYKDSWQGNPYNPVNNINYDTESSGLPTSHEHNAWTKVNPFFHCVPNLAGNSLLLAYQKAFVDRLLAISLAHDHVLYSIDNETNAPPQWGRYWAAYVKAKAQAANRRILVTEMWDNWDPTGGAVPGIRTIQSVDDHPHLKRSTPLNTIDHPESYDFIDISNNNGQVGQVHYETGLWVRNHIATRAIVRPINNVKIYGGPRDQDWCRDAKEGKERFWRNIFAGHAAVRFHRPPSGIGISQEALCQVRSARQLANRVDFFTMVPASELLGQREANEAYCLTNKANEVVLYFPGHGDVSLDVPAGEYQMSRLCLQTAEWDTPETVRLPGKVTTETNDPQVILLVRK